MCGTTKARVATLDEKMNKTQHNDAMNLAEPDSEITYYCIIISRAETDQLMCLRVCTECEKFISKTQYPQMFHI